MTQPAVLEIRSYINSRPMSRMQWTLTVLCFLIVFCDGLDVAIMGFLAPAITGDWGISKPAFGLVMAAAPVGLAIGAIFAGSSSDWFGRRRVLLASVFAFGVLSLLTALTQSPAEMAVLRFLTGLGLGAAMPNTTTLLSEYLPEQKRSVLLAIMFTGFNFGSAIIGFVAAYLLPKFGWHSVLVFGGIVPLALSVILFFLLPESARFMVVRGVSIDRIRNQLAGVTGQDLKAVSEFTLEDEPVTAAQPVALLFTPTFIIRTLSLWMCYFMGLLVIYLTTSWLPTMIKDAGMPIETAASVTAMFQLGGTIGAVVVGFAMHRVGSKSAISLAYLLGAAALVVLAFTGLTSVALALIVGIVGFFMSGGQTGLNAYAPGRYPTFARATGVSWMLGIGRLGSILGSSIGGLLLGFGWDFRGIFCALAVPAAIGAAAILINELQLTPQLQQRATR
ncbi:MFS transporter [Rhizobium mayense]|uniref:MFS transporter n=1 Tax=Rhizobium mayense TaxID=1312184 RepID=A0ABT7K0Q1_9HYPH|nr:MFS transporter [Rhizobium mayense]MDL2402101.1 MFS transporter [Rhizobium mayense]